MKDLKQYLAIALGMFLISQNVLASESNDALINKLKESKHSLLEGIQQAELSNGVAISAKFELDGSKLMLSVYTAKDGIAKDAEHNTLTEVNGEATNASWVPGLEVFEDKAHVSRATTHLTLMQLSKLTLKDVIKRATYSQEGTVYSVTPMIKSGKAVCEVLIATITGETVSVMVGL